MPDFISRTEAQEALKESPSVWGAWIEIHRWMKIIPMMPEMTRRPNPMSEERKVMCPCGKEMMLCEAEGIIPAYRYIASYHCGCGWNSPVRDGTTREEAAEEAYAAATTRPPNLPLTHEQIVALPAATAIWCYSYSLRSVNVYSAEDLRDGWKYDGYRDPDIMFASNPTAADIEAARAGKEGQR